MYALKIHTKGKIKLGKIQKKIKIHGKYKKK
jgi:hypothetical protein